jgi:imidazole glycerol-phosphate synthase subunit HisF
MRRIRVIPVLLLHKGGLVKSVKFKQYKYVGDPINAVKIFNDKEIDEIVVLDIDASAENRGPQLGKIKEIAGEAFIPLAYGGGINDINQVKELFYLGVEKVVFNLTTPD